MKQSVVRSNEGSLLVDLGCYLSSLKNSPDIKKEIAQEAGICLNKMVEQLISLEEYSKVKANRLKFKVKAIQQEIEVKPGINRTDNQPSRPNETRLRGCNQR